MASLRGVTLLSPSRKMTRADGLEVVDFVRVQHTLRFAVCESVTHMPSLKKNRVIVPSNISCNDLIQRCVARAQVPVGAKSVDCTGKYVMPGGIDPHTHLDMPFMGTTTADDFYTGHCAALAGGTTLHVDFALPINHDLEAG